MSVKAIVNHLVQGERLDLSEKSLGVVPFERNRPAIASSEIIRFVNETLETPGPFKKIKQYISQKISGEQSFLAKKINKILKANIPSPLHPHMTDLPQNQNSLDLLFKTISQANQYTDENLMISAIYQYEKITEALFSKNISEEQHGIHVFLLEILLKRHGLSSVQTAVFYALARIYLNTESIASQKVLQSFVYADGDPYLKLFCLDLFEVKNAMTPDDLATFRVSALGHMLLSDKEAFAEDLKKLDRLKIKVADQADYLSLSESKYVEELLKENKNIHVLKKAIQVYLFHETYFVYLDGAVQKLKKIIPPEILKLSLLQNTLTEVIAQVKAEVGILRKRPSKISEIKTENTNGWSFEVKDGEFQFSDKLKDFEALNHQMLLFASTPNENIEYLRQKLAENIAVYRDLMHKKLKQYDEDFDLLVKDTLALEDSEYTKGNHFRNYLRLNEFIQRKFNDFYFKHLNEINDLKNSENDDKFLIRLYKSDLAEDVVESVQQRDHEWLRHYFPLEKKENPHYLRGDDANIFYTEFCKTKTINFENVYFSVYPGRDYRINIEPVEDNFRKIFKDASRVGEDGLRRLMGVKTSLLIDKEHPYNLLRALVKPNYGYAGRDHKNLTCINLFDRLDQVILILKNVLLSVEHKNDPKNFLKIEYDQLDINQAKRALVIKEFSALRESLAQLANEIQTLSIRKEVLFENEKIKITLVANKFDQSIKISGKIKTEQIISKSLKSKNGFVIKTNPELKTVYFSKKIDMKTEKIDMALLYADLLKLVNSFLKN